MSENKKGRISNVALKVSNSKISNIYSGGYDYLLSLDIEGLVKKFNNGDYSVLDTPEIGMFLDTNITAIKLIDYILNAKALLQMKDDFYSEVESLQDGMVYDPESVYYSDRYSYGRGTLTYSQADSAFRLAEYFVSSSRTYALLNFLLKYENLIEPIRTRKQLFEIMENNPEGIEQMHLVLDKYDPNVGIVKIVEDGEVTVKVGTKHDMEISDLIGRPFPADCDEPGYDYGPYGDWHHGPHKVEKIFYENGTTPNHQKLIEAERKYRIRLGQSTIDEDGFVIAGNKAIIISSSELTKLGIDPTSIGWTPLRLTIQPENLFKLCKQHESTKYLSLGTKVQLKKDIILSKRR